MSRTLIPMLVGAAGLLVATNTVFAGGFHMTMKVTPNPMPYDYQGAELIVTTHSGAVCTADVLYIDTNRHPVSFIPVTVKSNGHAIWYWHEKTISRTGEATATCTYKHTTETRRYLFKIH